eukprot:4738547-Prorocentrum_lima.AAC.1
MDVVGDASCQGCCSTRATSTLANATREAQFSDAFHFKLSVPLRPHFRRRIAFSFAKEIAQ